LFDGRIIVDQQWALEAIYAVFERSSGVYSHICDNRRGRFTRSELAKFLWDEAGHDEGAQELFLSMMRSCRICFVLKEDTVGDRETEYVAPELLPERDTLSSELADHWDETLDEERATFRYKLVPPGLLRSLMAEIGEKAGLRADYWRDGFYFYDAKANARAMIEQQYDEKGWGGSIELRTQRGDAAALLVRLCDLVDKEQQRIGVTPVQFEGPDREKHAELERRPMIGTAETKGEIADDLAVAPDIERDEKAAVYVSYAWGTEGTEEERRRGEFVESLCREGENRNIRVVRDCEAIQFGDRISRFMDKLAGSNRIFVVLSAKYLRSPFCMYELHTIFRNVGHNEDEFGRRIRVFNLPDADYQTTKQRLRLVKYWQSEQRELAELIDDVGSANVASKSHQEQRLMARFVQDTDNLLSIVADTKNRTNIDNIDDLVFEWN